MSLSVAEAPWSRALSLAEVPGERIVMSLNRNLRWSHREWFR